MNHLHVAKRHAGKGPRTKRQRRRAERVALILNRRAEPTKGEKRKLVAEGRLAA